MTDCFALLEQPRRPCLSEEELKKKYHEKTRATHPDIQGGADRDTASSAAINEAYEVLHDPARRLRHLLDLEGVSPATSNGELPAELTTLFPIAGELSQNADRLLQKSRAATNALSKSLLKPELLAMQEEVKRLLDILRDLYNAALSEIRKIDEIWIGDPQQFGALQSILTKITYLRRWISDLEEKQFQLSIS